MSVRPSSRQNFKMVPFHDLECVSRTLGTPRGPQVNQFFELSRVTLQSKVRFFVLPFFICHPLKKSQKRWSRDVRVFQPIMGGTLYFCGAKTSRPTPPARCLICVKQCRSMAAVVYFLPVSFSTVQALALFSVTPGTNLTRTYCIPHHSLCQLMTSNVESIMRWFFSLALACENSRLSLFLAAGDVSARSEERLLFLQANFAITVD